MLLQISNLSSQNKDEYEHACLSSRLGRQDSCPAVGASGAAGATAEAAAKKAGRVDAIAGAEEQLWKDFSASFRRRNNKIG
jgi:hypothetical protein